MKSFKKCFYVSFFLILSFITITSYVFGQQRDDFRTLLVIFDGLRPDYITPDLMPNLYSLGKSGGFGKQHHSVFPTVTRVNAPSLATGTYPQKHGILGNTIYLPGLASSRIINTGNANELMEVSKATSGDLLTVPSLGEILQEHGKRMMVFSSGSTGQAFLQHHTVTLTQGAIINPDLILPVSLKENLLATVGEIPAESEPNTSRHQWVVDAFTALVLTPDGPEVSTLWFNDPDATAHSEGIGSLPTLASIKIVDQELGRLLDSLESRKMREKFNIIVTTDHGFATQTGQVGLTDFLVKNGLKRDKDSEEVIVAGGAVFVKDHDPAKIKQIVATLQAEEWVGAIFTKATEKGEQKGWVAGTLSFESIHWGHPERAADILVDVHWDNKKNEYGYEGNSAAPGVAGHGSSSPYEIHIPLILSGPSFKKRFESDLPTSNVDITPTILHLHHMAVPQTMDGRIMKEFLLTTTEGTQEEAQKVVTETTAKYDWGAYKVTIQQSILNNHRYLDFTQVTRKYNP